MVTERHPSRRATASGFGHAIPRPNWGEAGGPAVGLATIAGFLATLLFTFV
ncbi:MAG: hypothetical protein P9F19_15175 [Candidatus Contendobacter sp.]|nr:hypothetical protein [Candidatus Contendobacter sp.]MDG4558715.1 hypothetical protein [Candidatus Contendobacter sp.]